MLEIKAFGLEKFSKDIPTISNIDVLDFFSGLCGYSNYLGYMSYVLSGFYQSSKGVESNRT